MKTKEKKIKAWLDFIQADLDALPLDKRISLIYSISEDVFFNCPIELPGLSQHGTIDSWSKVREALGGVDDSEVEASMLRLLPDPMWKDIQIESREFLEEVIHLDIGQVVAMEAYQYLQKTPSGIFRKGNILGLHESDDRKKLAKAGIPVLKDLLNGIPGTAFKQCPECNKWFFHLSKRRKEFCSNRCASRYLTRKKRTETEGARKEYNKKMRAYMKRRHQKNNPVELVECPAGLGSVQMTQNKCRVNGKDKRYDSPAYTECPYLDEEGNAIMAKKKERGNEE